MGENDELKPINIDINNKGRAGEGQYSHNFNSGYGGYLWSSKAKEEQDGPSSAAQCQSFFFVGPAEITAMANIISNGSLFGFSVVLSMMWTEKSHLGLKPSPPILGWATVLNNFTILYGPVIINNRLEILVIIINFIAYMRHKMDHF